MLELSNKLHKVTCFLLNQFLCIIAYNCITLGTSSIKSKRTKKFKSNFRICFPGQSKLKLRTKHPYESKKCQTNSSIECPVYEILAI